MRAPRDHFVHALLEHRLHERVEPGGGFVEDQQLGVRRQRSDQRDLLTVALGVGPGLLGWFEIESFDELGSPLLVESAAQVPEGGR